MKIKFEQGFMTMSDEAMTLERLRELYGNPSLEVIDKVNDYLDKYCKEFIANSPFLVLASKLHLFGVPLRNE